MLPHRKILLSIVVLVVGGSLTWTAVYGLHLRSDAYRREVEADLTEFFELPSEVGRIRGRTFSSRAFENVIVWLPDRRDRVFQCDTAVWRELKRKDREENELDLIRGVLNLGNDSWAREDYRQVLESGLGHNFEDLHLKRVSLEGFEINFTRGGLMLCCRETSGLIDMSAPGDGIARLHAYELNGHRISQGVQIHARFLPSSGLQVSELILTLPRVPLTVIGLESFLGGSVTQGSFAGNLHYLDADGDHELWLKGDLEEVDLSELTRILPYGPLEGRFSVNVDAARVAQEVVTHFRGRGRIRGLRLEPLGALLGQAGTGGTAAFEFDTIDLALGRINRLRFSGIVNNVSLREWLRSWGRGTATGQVTILVNNLDVVDDAIKSADIEIRVLPPADGPGLIDRQLLLTAAEQMLDFTWPASLPQRILPEQVEYAEFGMRLLVRDNRLRILGTHGPDGETILTIKVGGMAFGIIKEQTGSIDLAPMLADIRRRAKTYDTDRVRDWWKARRSPVRTEPSSRKPGE